MSINSVNGRTEIAFKSSAASRGTGAEIKTKVENGRDMAATTVREEVTMNISELLERMQKTSREDLQKIKNIVEKNAGSQSNIAGAARLGTYQAIGPWPHKPFGILIRPEPEMAGAETILQLRRPLDRDELINAVGNAIDDCEDHRNVIEKKLPGSQANYESVHRALVRLRNALIETRDCDDNDHNYVVLQSLVRFMVATETLDNSLPKEIFPKKINTISGGVYLKAGGNLESLDTWTEQKGRPEHIIDTREFSKNFESSKTCGDYSHMLRPRWVLKIAEHAGGASFVETFLDESGRLIGSDKRTSMKSEIMEELIFEFTGSLVNAASSQICREDVKKIFIGLMEADESTSGSDLRDLQPIEFSSRCEKAVAELQKLESNAGGKLKQMSEDGYSPLQNLIVLLANMPKRDRELALNRLYSTYRDARPDRFVLNGISALAKACLQSLNT